MCQCGQEGVQTRRREVQPHASRQQEAAKSSGRLVLVGPRHVGEGTRRNEERRAAEVPGPLSHIPQLVNVAELK